MTFPAWPTLKRLVADAVRENTRGSAFPTVYKDGDRFYRTDLAEWFTRSDAFSGWLGDSGFDMEASTNGGRTASQNLQAHSLTYGLLRGWTVPYQAKVVRMQGFFSGSTGNTGTVNVEASTGAAFIALPNVTLPIGNGAQSSTPTSGTAAVANSLLVLRTGTSSTINDVYYVRATLRRFET